MDTTITRAEHEEFMRHMSAEHKRLEDEDRRQNKRLDDLESGVRELTLMAASVEKLATNMDGMLRELERQGKRLETLEGRDGEMWRKVAGYIASAVVGAVVCFIFAGIGM